MRSTCTALSGRFLIDFQRIFMAFSLCATASGCAQKLDDRSSMCNFEPNEIIRAVSSDPRLRSYAAESWATPRAVVLWDRSSAQESPCASASDQLLFVKSSTDFDRSQPFVAIEKIYYDENAAFVEIGFPPSGKNADVFMRKGSTGWRVKQLHLWEN